MAPGFVPHEEVGGAPPERGLGRDHLVMAVLSSTFLGCQIRVSINGCPKPSRTEHLFRKELIQIGSTIGQYPRDILMPPNHSFSLVNSMAYLGLGPELCVKALLCRNFATKTLAAKALLSKGFL